MDDDGFFAVLDPEANSIALLMKHMGGNLRSRFTDFLTTDGEKPDRDRDAEFELGPADSREEILTRWAEGWNTLFAALHALTPADLQRVVKIRGEPHSVLEAISRQLAHQAQHVGQIVLLAKHHAGSRWRTLSIPRGQSGAFTRQMETRHAAPAENSSPVASRAVPRTTSVAPPLSSYDAIALYTRLIEAWNRRDAEGFSAVFAADGRAIGFDGSEMTGRREIAEQLGAIFAHHPTAPYVARVREVQLLEPDIAILRAAVGMVPPGRRELDPAVNAIQTLVVSAREGAPRVALLQNTPAAFHGRPHLVAELTTELAAVLAAGVVVATD